MNIILTRAAEQNAQLAKLIEVGEVLSMPLMAAEPIPLAEQMKQRLLALDQFDDVIFISRNAVRYGLPLMEQYWPQWPVNLRWFAVGSGTAAALRAHDIDAAYPAQASSEGLLAIEALQNVRGRQCLIVRGVGGRETLKEGLESRAAKVSYLEAYQRQALDFNVQNLPESAVVLIYSGEALEHFATKGADIVRGYQLIVPSARLRDMAIKQGFAKVELANSQEDHAMLEVLRQLTGSSR